MKRIAIIATGLLLVFTAVSFCAVFMDSTKSPVENTVTTNTIPQNNSWENSPFYTKTGDKTGSDKTQTYGYRVLNFGEVPWDKEEKIRKFHRRFLPYLSRQLGIPVILNIAPDYITLQKDIIQGNIQIAAFTPGAYGDALLAIPDKIRYVATLKWHDSQHYEGFIFARKDTAINTIEDLKHKTIAFSDYGSASGFKFPISVFLTKGIDPDTYFSRMFFLGSPQAVLQGVLSGHADAGSTYDRAYEHFQAANNEPFKIIAKTPKIPFGPYVVSKTIPDPLFMEIRHALINLDKNTLHVNGKPILSDDYSLTGFVVQDESVYKVAVETAELVNKYMTNREKGKQGRME